MSRRCVRLGLLVALLVVAVGCAGRPQKGPRSDAAARDLDLEDLRGAEQALAEARQENDELRRQLAEQLIAIDRSDEAHISLNLELEKVLEELLRSKASIRGIENRALATSRIAETRVFLESAPETDDPEVERRIERAMDLLRRADVELSEGNFGGAVYLADRADELQQYARMVAAIRESTGLDSAAVVPIVPARLLVVMKNANIREGPGLNRTRIDTVDSGVELLVTARSRGWYRVTLDTGRTGWVHSSLVGEPEPSP